MKSAAIPSPADLLIIGAGISGLSAAREFQKSGRRVVVLEKSRGLGGRAATRRWDGWPVDHGAQFFTVRSDDFQKQTDDWLARGVCHQWTRGFHQYRDGELLPPEQIHPRYVCAAGMSSLGRDLARELMDSIQTNTKVTRIEYHEGVWVVTTEEDQTFRSNCLLMTPPPDQSAALLETTAPAAAEKLRQITMAPCLALALRFPRRQPAWHGIQCHGHPVLSWISHDTSKRPTAHPESSVIVLHATPEFSRAHYTDSEDSIVPQMISAATDIGELDLTRPEGFFLHRWRYATAPEQPNDQPKIFAYDVPGPLVLAGDGIAGGKIEGAWLSGRTAAEHLKSCAIQPSR